MPATATQAFDAWCRFLNPTEGGLSLEATDPGNWTSGKPGIGKLIGTKFGIAASAHPQLDIANLTLDQANAIRKTEYWNAVRGDEVPAPIAFMLADAAYGSGPDTAIRNLQGALGVLVDGQFGLHTMAATRAVAAVAPQDEYGLTPLSAFLSLFAATRLLFEASLAIWPLDKGGWTSRLFRSVLVAQSLV